MKTAFAISYGGGTVNGKAVTQVTLLLDDLPAWRRPVDIWDQTDIHQFAQECATKREGIDAGDIRTMLTERGEEARESGFIPRSPSEDELKNAFDPPLPPELAWMQRQTAAQLITNFPDLKVPLISGILRIGEVANWVAGPKARKSYMIEALALCIAQGKPWLNLFQTKKSRVLLIDNELHKETLAHRIKHVAHALGAGPEAVESIDVISLRGMLVDLYTLEPLIRSIAPRTYGAVILDALYKFQPDDFDENGNSGMMRFYAKADQYAALIDSAFIGVHHTSKGIQGGKAVTDVGAGAGTQSRTVDTHLILREHEDEGCVVVDAAVRSWPPLKAFGIRWDYPLWSADDSIDVTKIKRENKGGRPRKGEEKAAEPADEPWTPQRFVNEFIGAAPVSREIIESRANRAKIAYRTVAGLIAEAEAEKLIFQHRKPGSNAKFYSTKEPDLYSVSDGVSLSHTPPSTPSAKRRKDRR